MNEEKTVYYSFECTQDLDTYKDIQKAYQRTRSRNLIADCALILFMIFANLTFIHTDLFITYYLLFFSVGCLAGLIIVHLKNINGDDTYKGNLVSNGGKTPRYILEFTEQGIKQTDSDTGSHGLAAYDRVRKVVVTKKNLIIVLNYSQVCCIHKWAIAGNEDPFLSFLKTKCANWKRKKPVTCLLGQILYILKIAVLVLCILLNVLIPVLNLTDRTPADPTRDNMTIQEIVVMLEELGISSADPNMLAQLEAVMADHPDRQYSNEEKIIDVLFYMNYDIFNADTGEWTTASDDVFYFDLECIYIDKMYSDFLRGIRKLDPELDFENISEDNSGADYEHNQGKQSANFSWNGTSYRITGQVNYDWFDLDAADDLRSIIKNADTGKQLYFASDTGTGIIIFYRDAAWAEKFESTTGIKLYDSAMKLYYGID